MTRPLLISRRSILRGLAAGGLLPLAGCSLDSRDRRGDVDPRQGRNALTEAAQRALLAPRLALAPEYPPGAISAYFKPNGSIDPDDPDYVAARQRGFSDWRLEVGGLVERPMKLSLADLRALPSRSQITRHDCVEGWSCIGQWKGAQLAALLTAAGLKPQARYIAFFCADTLEQTLDNNGRYYETIDLVDAFHPQTILAYEMNYAPLDGRARRAAEAPGRAPARLQDGQIRDADRGDRQLRRARARPRRLLGGPRLRMVRRDLTAEWSAAFRLRRRRQKGAAGIGQRLAARREEVAQQKEAGHAEAVGDLIGAGRRRARRPRAGSRAAAGGGRATARRPRG